MASSDKKAFGWKKKLQRAGIDPLICACGHLCPGQLTTQPPSVWMVYPWTLLKPSESHRMAMHPFPSKLVFSTGQNQPEGVQNLKISPDGDHALALIFGGPAQVRCIKIPNLYWWSGFENFWGSGSLIYRWSEDRWHCNQSLSWPLRQPKGVSKNVWLTGNLAHVLQMSIDDATIAPFPGHYASLKGLARTFWSTGNLAHILQMSM